MPFIIGLFAFTLIPIIASFALSFTNYDILSTPKFAGLDNFIRMFTQDPVFWKSFGVTFFYAVVSVPLKLIMALMVAMFFQRSSKATSVYRAVYYLPSIMGGSVAVAVLWRRMFASDGVINSVLQQFGIACDTGWLSGTKTAIWTLIILSVWQFGSSMLVFLAGLKQIPVTLYEAAKVDGCSRVKQFFKITLPMLTPIIFFNLIQQTINAFMAFTQSYVITGGKPLNSTLFYTVYMYQRSFQYSEMGYGSAMAWFMLIVVAFLTIMIFRSSNSWVYRASEEE
ncbi:carbohydrate ABC transporter permease [Anaerocolumna sp. MB42-C2]|uniref:carbohydrate ABC transporter permease n=1 Tax=Anaerocolumna sp. MB42-C2 TaxID=3070997 RepID=UPI0027E1EE3C|nr:sugar ABC transporter permease [Anaerocolumna sp. MB42-C2]WMJ85328.1 sugar ABC transporter permease [Anaerocolumna sp. MB42-C2]